MQYRPSDWQPSHPQSCPGWRGWGWGWPGLVMCHVYQAELSVGFTPSRRWGWWAAVCAMDTPTNACQRPTTTHRQTAYRYVDIWRLWVKVFGFFCFIWPAVSPCFQCFFKAHLYCICQIWEFYWSYHWTIGKRASKRLLQHASVICTPVAIIMDNNKLVRGYPQ